MPTPYGTCGGMAFAAAELRVLRRALALALHPTSATVQDVQDCHRLAESVDDAAREGARFRAFLRDDLVRYRGALPGAANGYLALLSDALDAAYRPQPDDVAALRALSCTPDAAALLTRCRAVLEEGMTVRRADRAPFPAARAERTQGAGAAGRPMVPASRRRLMALPGGLASGASEPAEPREPADAPDTGGKPEEEQPGTEPETTSEPEREKEPARKEEPTREEEPARKEEPAREEEPTREGEPERGQPAEPGRPAGPPAPGRHVPTPAEVFPPKRKPAPPADPPQQRAAG